LTGEAEIDDELDDEEDDDLDQDASIPEYMLKTPEEQRKYFDKLTKEYLKNLQKAKEMTREHTRKVNFHMNRITVKGN
jgi:hypothetical protein